MTVATMDAGGDFRIGSVVNRAWGILSANFLFFFAVTFIVALPNLLFLMGQTQPPAFRWGLVIAVFAGLILNTIGQAIILFGAFQQLRGQSVQTGEALQRALARFLPLIGLAILYSLGIAIGFVLLVVPGFILLVRWAVVVPACIVPQARRDRSVPGVCR